MRCCRESGVGKEKKGEVEQKDRSQGRCGCVVWMFLFICGGVA